MEKNQDPEKRGSEMKSRNFMTNFKKYSSSYHDNDSAVPGIDNDYGTDEGGTEQWVGLRNLDPDREGGRAAPPPFSSEHPGPERKGFKSEAEIIRQGIMNALTDADDADPSDVEVTVENGIVTLEGTVPAEEMIRTVENYAMAVPGVDGVDNRLKTASPKDSSSIGNNSSDSNEDLIPPR